MYLYLKTNYTNTQNCPKDGERYKTLIDKVNLFGKILAFDSTVITLDYLKSIIENKETGIEIIVATGQSDKNKKLVREKFALVNKETHKRVIALCSDAMAEGINLPSAKALLLLDMPSVLRIIEQRIGRLERMDSEHKEIHVFWPDDSEEFSLNGDKRVVETLLLADKLIKGNVDIPEQIYEKHLKNGMKTKNFINAYQEYVSEEYGWQGVRDSTQYLYSLIEGKGSLIDNDTYNEFKDVESTVKTAVCFVESDKTWSFFSFRGDSTRSPKWLFIDENDNAYTDFSIISEKLKIYLNKKNIIQRKWNEVDTPNEIKKIIYKLRLKERELLSWKKKRALSIAEKLLKQLEKKDQQMERRELTRKLIYLFSPMQNEDLMIDYDRFAEMWLTILQPALDMKRKTQLRKRKIITLRDLTLSDLNFDIETLTKIYESCQLATTLDEMIAACIIGIRKSE